MIDYVYASITFYYAIAQCILFKHGPITFFLAIQFQTLLFLFLISPFICVAMYTSS